MDGVGGISRKVKKIKNLCKAKNAKKKKIFMHGRKINAQASG